ncbi:MAG TPA: Sir2 family NAD-dependent protein deacetylase [Candidatus Methylomirabilis sp.]|nr:Sir2 family NAD-dependent protein deacetylase [Candidatus Methylomirabilis sp.]
MSGEGYGIAADAVRNAGALIITAGAGMGVDSGLPDFRGERGFWNAYPMYERLGLTFVGAANPAHFEQDPAFGWGFYGHRTNLYRGTEPHRGFRILKEWIGRFDLPYFVVTSNVDGQFQKAGFDEESVLEVHGSIHHLQCLKPCSGAIWPHREEIPVDIETMRSLRIPRCIRCGGVARPNVLMFGDFSWIGDRTDRQEGRFGSFLEESRGRGTVVLEMGAGTSIPTIRNLSERLGRRKGVTVARINPREPWIDAPHLSIPEGALAALTAIDKRLRLLASPLP